MKKEYALQAVDCGLGALYRNKKAKPTWRHPCAGKADAIAMVHLPGEAWSGCAASSDCRVDTRVICLCAKIEHADDISCVGSHNPELF